MTYSHAMMATFTNFYKTNFFENLLKNFKSKNKEGPCKYIKLCRGLVLTERIGSVSERKWHVSKFWKVSTPGPLERKHHELCITGRLETEERF